MYFIAIHTDAQLLAYVKDAAGGLLWALPGVVATYMLTPWQPAPGMLCCMATRDGIHQDSVPYCSTHTNLAGLSLLISGRPMHVAALAEV